MDISIPYANTTSKEEAIELAKKAITPEMLSKFQVNADMNFEADKITAKGSGFELILTFNESCVDVDLNLSLMLRAFKGKVLEGLEKQIKRIV